MIRTAEIHTEWVVKGYDEAEDAGADLEDISDSEFDTIGRSEFCYACGRVTPEKCIARSSRSGIKVFCERCFMRLAVEWRAV